MAGSLGRSNTLTVGGSAVAGVRTKSASHNNELIDISDDDSAGWMEILDEPGEKVIELSLEGLIKDDTLRAAYHAATVLDAVVITYADGGSLSGNFGLATYNEGMPYKEAVTFEATLRSSGSVTYTPAP